MAYRHTLLLSIRYDFGSDYRLWKEVALQSEETLLWCTLQLPQDGGAQHDELWLKEVDGLNEDLVCLQQAFGAKLKRVLIVGDCNLQPDILSFTQEPNKRRMRAWDRLMEKWDLVLHNPRLDGVIREVWSPLRSKHLAFQSSSTHHGLGSPRAIDLVYSTGDLLLDVRIHNSLNCAPAPGVPCVWPGCLDFAKGDHFLLEILLQACGKAAGPKVTPCFPSAWHNAQRWARALQTTGALFSDIAGRTEL